MREDAATCPFCGGQETHRVALYGQLLATAQHYCRRCRVVFEHVRAEGARRDEQGGGPERGGAAG